MKFLTIISFISLFATCRNKGTVSFDGRKSFSNTTAPIVKWEWAQVSGPMLFQINNANTPVISVDYDNPPKGTYIISLTVTDSLGNVGSKTAPIIVN
jgi:hypothetical protein